MSCSLCATLSSGDSIHKAEHSSMRMRLYGWGSMSRRNDTNRLRLYPDQWRDYALYSVSSAILWGKRAYSTHIKWGGAFLIISVSVFFCSIESGVQFRKCRESWMGSAIECAHLCVVSGEISARDANIWKTKERVKCFFLLLKNVGDHTRVRFVRFNIVFLNNLYQYNIIKVIFCDTFQGKMKNA